jgi:hypothetical protein
MIILALDASTTAAGWVLANDGDHLISGVYRPRGHDAHARIAKLETWLSGKIGSELWLIAEGQIAEIEAVFYEKATGSHGNMETDRLLGAVEYVIVKTARLHAVDLGWVTASQVKASGIHKDTPDAVAEAITGGPLDGQNAGDHKDAIGVWLAGLAKWRESAWLGKQEGKTL